MGPSPVPKKEDLSDSAGGDYLEPFYPLAGGGGLEHGPEGRTDKLRNDYKSGLSGMKKTIPGHWFTLSAFPSDARRIDEFDLESAPSLPPSPAR